jgi:uncharacterized protein
MNPFRFRATPHCYRLLAGTASFLVLTSASPAALFKKSASDFSGIYQSGNIPAALNTVTKEATANATSKDAILWKLEQGATLRTAALADPGVVPAIADPSAAAAQPGDAAAAAPAATPADVSSAYIKQSLLALDQAEEKVNSYEEQAKVKVASEVSASLTNLSALPYRGRAYDKVLMNAYKALNYMQLGQIDNARVELNRALQRQKDAVAQNEKRISEAQETAEKAKNGEVKDENGKSAAYDSDKAQQDSKTGPALNAVLAESTANLVSYGDYVNPFAVFLDGLFFTVRGEGGSDLERGRKSMERVVAMVPDNPYAKADLGLALGAAEGKAPENVTYIFFETGTGPDRDETKIQIPTFLVTSKLAYVGAAFPKLKFNTNYVGSLGVKAGEQTVATATLASIDSVVANDFKNEWPVVVTKTLVSTATKAIVQASAQKSADHAGLMAGLVGKVALTAFNAATTHADTRVWSSLPKEFQYARVDTPADRQLTLAAGNDSRTITLVPGVVNVVYVKSISPSSSLLVSQFALK